MTASNEKIEKAKVLKEQLQKQAATKLFQPLLTVSDLEALLKVKRETVKNLVKRGELPMPIKLGGSNRWRPEEISATLDRLSRRVGRKIEQGIVDLEKKSLSVEADRPTQRGCPRTRAPLDR